METFKIGQFVFVDDVEKTGIIVADENCAGVFRGHYVVWFGERDDADNPVVHHLFPKFWSKVDRPIV